MFEILQSKISNHIIFDIYILIFNFKHMRAILNYLEKDWLELATIIFTLIFLLLGFPAQIMKIWETQSVREVSIVTFGLLFVQSFFWVLHGSRRKDWFLVVANVLSCIFAAVIIFEYFLFS